MCTKHLVIHTIQYRCIKYCSRGGGGDGVYYNCLYREAPPKKVLFSGFRYMKGFFIVEVYERDIFDFSLLKDQNEITDAFIDVRDKKTCFSYLFIL